MSDATIRILKNSLQKLFRQGLSLMTDTRGEMFVITIGALGGIVALEGQTHLQNAEAQQDESNGTDE